MVKCPWRTILLNKDKCGTQPFLWFNEKKSILIAKVYISFQDLLFLVFKSYFVCVYYLSSYISKFSKYWRVWCHFVMQLLRCNFVFTLPLHKNLLKVHKMLLFSIPHSQLCHPPQYAISSSDPSVSPWLLSMFGSH